jgi:hypothetical protein
MGGIYLNQKRRGTVSGKLRHASVDRCIPAHNPTFQIYFCEFARIYLPIYSFFIPVAPTWSIGHP